MTIDSVPCLGNIPQLKGAKIWTKEYNYCPITWVSTPFSASWFKYLFRAYPHKIIAMLRWQAGKNDQEQLLPYDLGNIPQSSTRKLWAVSVSHHQFLRLDLVTFQNKNEDDVFILEAELAKFFFLSFVSHSSSILLGICFLWSHTLSQSLCTPRVTKSQHTSYLALLR